MSYKIILLSILCLSHNALSVEQVTFNDSNSRYPINLEVQQGTWTILQFEEKVREFPDFSEFSVKVKALSVESSGKVKDPTIIKLFPKKAGIVIKGTVLLDNKMAIKLAIRVVKKGSVSETKYMIRKSREVNLKNYDAGGPVELVSLFKTMFYERNRQDYQILTKKVEVASLDNDIEISLERFYKGKNLFGYVYKVQNNKGERVAVDLPRTLVESASKTLFGVFPRKILESGEYGYLFMVATTDSHPSGLVLELKL